MKYVYYLVGILLFGWIVSGITGFVIGFLPYVALGTLIALPFYGMIRNKFNLKDRKFGLRRFVTAFASYFKFGKRSWTFYLILGVAIGFIYEDIIWKIVETLSWSLVGLFAFWLVWEGVRLSIDKLLKIQIVSFGQALKDGWK